MSKGKKGLEGLDMTPQEVQSFTEAFKNEEFRKLFFEYAQELNDPENRKKYEEEIIALEQERGVDCEFLKPEPGYVLKTSVNGADKCFINVARCEKIGQPKSSVEQQNGARGLRWQVPHSCTPPREDVDKKGKRCTVYDVLFHPDTLRMADTNERFSKMVLDITCDEVEKFFKVKLDRSNVKKLKKIKYFGRASEAVIRKPRSDAAERPKLPPDDILASMPYPYKSNETQVYSDDRVTNGKQTEQRKADKVDTSVKSQTKAAETQQAAENADPKYAIPNYTVKYRYETDLQDYATLMGPSVASNRPSAIEVRIDLPMLSAASQVDVDVFERRLELQSERPAKYKLNLRFSYDVVADDANARFDKKARTLTITAPVRKVVSKPLIEELVSVVNNESTVETGTESSEISESDNNDKVSETPNAEYSTVAPTPEVQSSATTNDATAQSQSQPDVPAAKSDTTTDCQTQAAMTTDSQPQLSPSADSQSAECTCSSPTHVSARCQPHSILKSHSMPDGCDPSCDDMFASGKRRASKCVSFSDVVQVETPDYRKPVASAFEKVAKQNDVCGQKRNSESGSDSNAEESATQKTESVRDATPNKVDDSQLATSGSQSEVVTKSETTRESESEKDAKKPSEEFGVETMLSWDEKGAKSPVSEQSATTAEDSKKKRKRNKRKKNVSGDHAAAKAPNLNFENQLVDELDR